MLCGAVLHTHTSTDQPKCYFDASFYADTLNASFGAVLVSPDGGFVAACAGHLIDCFYPFMVETVACSEVLSWLTDKGVDSVDLCTDCSQLMSALPRVDSTFYFYVGFFY